MNISDVLLLRSYYKAIDQKIHSDFIEILKIEIDRRNLETTNHQV
ncbi:sporulation histidine kinase inhibitor Sda [Oceanobacillus sp. CF4.6]